MRKESEFGQTVPGLIFETAKRIPKKTALLTKKNSREFVPITYEDLIGEVERLGIALMSLGIEQGTKVALISENRYEWILCDLALLAIGAIDVPRSSQCSAAEVEYILKHSESEMLIVESGRILETALPDRSVLPGIRTILTIEKSSRADIRSIFDLESPEGEEPRKRFYERLASLEPGRPATIIYTSGTTATPKGVVLSHSNIAHNMRTLPDWEGVDSEDTYLSILPSWHAFERTVEYTALACGATVAYSRPVPSVMLDDMRKVKPTVIVAVPRIWQAMRDAVLRTASSAPLVRRKLFGASVRFGMVYSKLLRLAKNLLPEFGARRHRWKVPSAVLVALLNPVRSLFDILIYRKIRAVAGGKLRLAISGGGALPKAVEEFFWACNFPLVKGYGLTEAAPIVACRRLMKDASYTVGRAVPETEVKIVDKSGRSLPPGEAGEVLVRGPQVMLGYHKLENETRLVIDPDGWLHTGDLGMLTTRGELTITGRMKDTIVLISGENIEPEPLEEALKESRYIDHVILVGHDRAVLGALVVPNLEAFEEELTELGREISKDQRRELAEMKEIVAREISRLVSASRGFKRHERIAVFSFLKDAFEVGEELTMTLKLRRNYIMKKFSRHIDEMYSTRKEN